MGGLRTAAAALTHANPLVRAGVAWTVGCVLMLATWSLTYHWLPERVAADVWLAGRLPLPLAASSGTEHLALGIFAWNLLLGGGTLVVASLFRVGRVPAVYVAPWLWFVAYGVLLGTNSFAFPNPTGRVGPDVALLSGHVGLLEMSAYALVAGALADFSLWHHRSWRDARLTRVRRWSQLRLSALEALVLLAGVGLLGWSASTEAGQIFRLFA